MIRIFLPLILAVVAYFGPWTMDSLGSFSGADAAGPAVNCLTNLNFSLSGACAPAGGLAERMVMYTVLLGGAGAVLSILGLLPLIGRLTSIVVLVAGIVGVAAVVMIAAPAIANSGFDVARFGWGSYGTLILSLATLWSGLDGFRHGND